MNKLQKIIEDIFLADMYNCKSVGYGYKYKNGVQTDDLSIIFTVEDKKPLNQLPELYIIPSLINIDNMSIKTDVIENKNELKTLGCFNFDGSDVEINKLRSNPFLLKPIKGGQEIIQFPTAWVANNFGGYNIEIGTLGFFAIDNEDNKIVGVTNAHVACYEIKQNTDRDHYLYSLDDPAYNLYDARKWSPDNNLYRPGLRVIEPTEENPFNTSLPFTAVKRYSAFKKPINYIDVALLVPNTQNLSFFSSESNKVHTPESENLGSYFPFATTNELDSLLSINPKVYSVGRTTGPKGWGNLDSCKLKIKTISFSARIGNVDRGVFFSTAFSDLITYEHVDSSLGAVGGGDSGSVLLAEINGVVKIIGLVFAGAIQPGQNIGNEGVACRIDRVAQEMNIRSWNSNDNVDFDNGNVKIFTRHYTDGDPNEPFVIIDGIKYYNVGLRGN